MRLFVIVLGLISSSVAWGHGLHATAPGFIGGLLHPMTGFDHVLAAAGIGWWLGLHRIHRSSILLYVSALAAGSALAILRTLTTGGMFGAIEWVLASTLILTGLLLWRLLRLSEPLVAAVIAAVFACHFYAHIIEMPAMPGASGVFFYAGGFFIGTALMIIVAAVAGAVTGKRVSTVWTRLAGAVIAVAGAAALGLA